MLDQFCTISLGKTVDGVSDEVVIKRLSVKFSLDYQAASLLLNNKTRVVKRSSDWLTATTLKTGLINLGLAADIKLVTNRELFFDSIRKKQSL